jgi:hypothetical protein
VLNFGASFTLNAAVEPIFEDGKGHARDRKADDRRQKFSKDAEHATLERFDGSIGGEL